jgi:hypothetical protein
VTDIAAEPRATTGRLQVNPGDTVASTWGNTTFDQTMEVFDTAAARDSQWPTPHDGAMAYTLDTQTAWMRRTGAWVAFAPGPAAAGILPNGYAQITANVALTTAMTAIAGLSVTVNVPANRRVRVSSSSSLSSNAAGATLIRPSLYADGAQVNQQLLYMVSGSFNAFSISAVLRPAAGSHTCALYALIDVAPGTIYCSAIAPAFILVEDIGGN